MNPEQFRNSYKEVYISAQAQEKLQELLDNPTQGNLAFYSDIRVSLNTIAGGYYEGIQYIGNTTWNKSFDFGGGNCYMSLICSRDYRKVAFYIADFKFDARTTNRPITITESQLRSIIYETMRNILLI